MPLDPPDIRPIHRSCAHRSFLSVGLSPYENSHPRDQRPHRVDRPTGLFPQHVLRLSRTAGGATEHPSLGSRPAASVTAPRAVGWRGCTRTGLTPLGARELDGVGKQSARSSRRRRRDGARRKARRGRGATVLLERSNILVNPCSGEQEWGEGKGSGQARPTSERCPPALSSALVDRSSDQTCLGMVGREVTQQMKEVGDPRTEWIVLQHEGQVTKREQRHDDPGGIARHRGLKEVATLYEPILLTTRREIAPTVAQFIEVPVASGVRRTQLGELRVERVLYDEHVPTKVTRQKREPFLFQHQGRHDGLLFVIEWLHVISSELSQAELPGWRVCATPKAQPSGPCGARLRACGIAAAQALTVSTV